VGERPPSLECRPILFGHEWLNVIDRANLRITEYANADRYFRCLFPGDRYIGAGADFQAAFEGRILVELEDHVFGASRILAATFAAVEVCDCPTVRVKDFFSPKPILSRYGLLWCAAWLFDPLRIAAVVAVGGEKAQTATTES